MRLMILCLLVLFTVACATEKNDFKKRVAKKNHRIHAKKNKSFFPSGKTKQTLVPIPSPTNKAYKSFPSIPLLKKIIPPVIANLKDHSEMALVNAGQYRLASSDQHAKTVTLPAFYIDRHEISVAQFKVFRPEYSETAYTKDKECPHCPAMAIDWKSADKYCQWAGKRLPSEQEWEASARGSTENNWPWGNRFFPEYTNALGNADGFEGPAPVGSFPPGTSIFGASDMAGNVWEWVSNQPSEPIGAPSTNSTKRIAKGGGWRSQKKETTIDFQNIVPADLKNPTFGFRCAKTAH